MRKLYQRTLRPELKREVNKTSRVIKSKTNESLNKKWEKTLKEIPGDRTIWQIAKSFKKPTQNIPTIVKNDKTYLTDKEKTHILGETLEDIQKNNEHSNKEIAITKTLQDFFNTFILPGRCKINMTNPKEVKNIIKSLQNNKAPGKDKIDNRLLKNLPRKIIVQLMYIINSMLRNGHYPSDWKMAVVIPIP